MLTRSGWLSRLARMLGLLQLPEQFPVLIQDPYAAGIVIAHVCMAAPFFLILFLNIYQNERIEDMREVASTLGARWYQSDFKITVPLLIHRSYQTIVLYFIFAMGSYEIPLLLGASSPQMLAVNVVRNLQQFSLDTIPAAYILSLLYVAFVLTILWILLRRKKLFYDL
jgi:putative spermidine/putrescine transport system permease protein